MKIVVTGTGYVGLITAVCLAEKGHFVICVEADASKVEKLRNGIPTIHEPRLRRLMRKNRARLRFTTNYVSAYNEARVVFICVGTPQCSDGSANIKNVEQAAVQIAENVRQNCLVVVKSTVPVGTNEKVLELMNKYKHKNIELHIASNPEFLAQGSAVHDTLKASRIVIGTSDKKSSDILRRIYSPFKLPIIETNIRSAEMIKYACNNFLALKISYINEIANLCDIFGANIGDIAFAMGKDPRIGPSFLKAGTGYGGSCFPKDTEALYAQAAKNGYELKTVKAAIEVNKTQRMWSIKKLGEIYPRFEGLKISVLGLAFKPNTDDLREAPSLYVVDELLKRGAKVTVWDREAKKNFYSVYGDYVTYAANVYDAICAADACLILTEWDEIRKLRSTDFVELMAVPVVIDGRNCLNTAKQISGGVKYFSVGRGAPRERRLL